MLYTRRVPSWRSRPSTPLLVTTIACAAIAVVLPYSPPAGPLGFGGALPPLFLAAVLGMVTTYLLLVEAAKRRFFRRQGL